MKWIAFVVCAWLAIGVSALVVGAASDAAVTVQLFKFRPDRLEIAKGTRVVWTNHDDIPHTTVSAGKFRSKTMDTDDKFSFTFTSAGDYKYFCSLHPHMTGMIKVE